MNYLDKLKEYHEITTDSGIMMLNLETFDNKIQMAIDLWPQKKGNSINYLFGKGLGVEIALRGQVLGRNKNSIIFPYRTHSDFEIYNSNNTNYSEIEDAQKFYYVFGAQEIYPKTRTKGLKNLPTDLMDSTYEEVVYKDNVYLIPNLELLFLDKYLKKESTPRKEGYDSDLLAMQYSLDVNLVFSYLEKYYIEEERKVFEEKNAEIYDVQINNINKLIKKIQEDDNFNDLVEIQKCLEEEFEPLRSYKNVIKNGINVSLLPINLYLTFDNQNEVVLSDVTKSEIKGLISKMFLEKEIEFNNLKVDLLNMFKKIGYDVNNFVDSETVKHSK